MDDNATGRDATDGTRRDATGATVVVSVEGAAQALGVSAGAVRKRIERGQLAGRKVGGRWQVVLDATDATGQDTTGTTDATRPGATGATPAVSPAAVAQLEAVRDEWLRPFVADVERLSREVGRLQAERDAALAEVERLTSAQGAPVASPGGQGAAGGPGARSDSPPPWWAFWRRR